MKDIHYTISDRYSPVIFSSKQVEEEKLFSLFEAARWAPSSYNEQPWGFIVGIKDKDENYEKLLNCLVDANKYWAKYAPVIVLSVSKKISSVTGKPNRFAEYDTGMAVGNLLTQATSLGLYVHQMGGYNMNEVRSLFDLGDEYEPMAVMAMGYKGDIDLFSDDLKEREAKKRYRKPLNELFL